MKHRYLFFFMLLTLCSAFTLISPGIVSAKTETASTTSKCVNANSTTDTLSGTLGGANYLIEVPRSWNGTLLLYSHGYSFVGSSLNAVDASDALTEQALLQQGYALAGSSYSQNGWALQQAFHDQITLLNFFDATCGNPTRTIPWGDSLGGMVTAGLVQLYPQRFAGAVPMCGVVAGGIGTWNQALDTIFAFNILLAGSTLPIVHLTDPVSALNQAETLITAAQATPQGRARIALAAALSDLPGWFTPGSPAPARNDFAAQEQNQYLWQSQVDFAFFFIARAELEARAGGNPSWNIAVDYRTQLQKSVDLKEVKALYQQAGLNLKQELDRLNAAPRISPDRGAISYLNKYITFDGDLDIPVLTMHTTGDGLVVNTAEQSYSNTARAGGDASLLRQVFVDRAGHCAFTPAENLVAISTLVQRLNTGQWGDSTNPTLLKREATALGPTLNTSPAAFLNFKPAPFLRPFTNPGR